jgi:hypothetical protein
MKLLIASEEYEVCQIYQLFSMGYHKVFQAESHCTAARHLVREKIDVAFFDPKSATRLALLAQKKGTKIISCARLCRGNKTCAREYGEDICKHIICSF